MIFRHFEHDPPMLADGLGRWAQPAAMLFGWGVGLRGAAYDRGWLASTPAPLPVISVGGLEAGGSGKTPIAHWLLRTLIERGLRVGLLTRGYKRRARGPLLRHPNEPAHPDALGDEAAMAIESGSNVWVAVNPDRRAGAAQLAHAGVQIAVMDDGFSHRALARDLDVVVLRGDAPFGRGLLMPAGSLREPPRALRRAHLAWLHHRVCDASSTTPALPEAFRGDVVVSRHVPGPVRAGATEVSLTGEAVVVAAGVARPQEVARDVERLGGEVAAFVPKPDHHHYTPHDLRALEQARHRARATAVVVTAKDAVKLARTELPFPCWVLHSRVEIVSGAEALEARLGHVLTRARSQPELPDPHR